MSSDCQNDRLYHFIRFENDVQCIFNEICRKRNISCVAVNLYKGNIYLKADYFIPLKSDKLLQINCSELLEKLLEIPYFSSVDVDANQNLTFCLKRSIVYSDVLNEVLVHAENYGMFNYNKSILVLLDLEREKDLENFRNSLLDEHIISILALNNFEIYFNKFDSMGNLKFPNCHEINCSDTGTLNSICQNLEEKIYSSDWKIESELNENICMDSKRYIEDNNVALRYDKSLSTIILAKNNLQNDLFRTGYIKHLVKDYMPKLPDYILHIASQGQNRNILKSGLLLGMLENIYLPQIYIFSQGVQCELDMSSEQFIQDHKNAIEHAMSQKYNSFMPSDSAWLARTESLVDAAVKFDFLKIQQSSVLNLRHPKHEERNFGIFIQYNYARLCALFRSFESKVSENLYTPLPKLEDTDFELLKLEEEWHLFHYVLFFPKTVQGVVDSLLSNEKGKYRLNRICLMLQELCQNLSLYYSKIRILTGPQPHLQRQMHARLWLLKGIQRVFRNSFALLNMKGLDQM